jgi:GNAT superfamily N-acetyltransferase
MDFVEIEHAAFQSWPSQEEKNWEGWVLRLSEGYTKRANSITVFTNPAGLLEPLILACETQFNSRQLPCVFRLLHFVDNTDLEEILISRGYNFADHTLTLFQHIQGKQWNGGKIKPMAIEDWMTSFYRLSQKDSLDGTRHLAILNRIRQPLLPAVLREGNEEVACGIGVMSGSLFGIFDIVIHPKYRNMGFGRELLYRMLKWAVDNGAISAYVQVVADNEPAVRLYHKCGYRPGYEYHYRIQDYRKRK